MKNNKPVYSSRLGAILVIASLGTAHADTINTDKIKVLTAAEITSTIGGNTLSGVFGEEKTRYVQRNHKNGIALVHIEGSDVRFIPWFVKDSGFYCEDWAKDGVACYKVGMNAKSGKYQFINADGTISETNLEKGFHSITFE
ncbi:hypothetical protein [Psychromonas ossibalaenae]|uniref:hypothetical protein n=1 Tax=Psychromonas ossibalaenae TaxID=444922 RepID=UPI000364364B|nr:hypothetical protein [Psychromonas ossibalaenae]